MFNLLLDSKFTGYSSMNFPTPINLNTWWNMGFLLTICVMLQMLVGVWLSCFVEIGDKCLISKHFMNKEINLGWVLVELHSILPNFMFFLMYAHILKNLLFPTYLLVLLWLTGVLMLSLLMVVSFTGYSLVFGAMGYWAMTVSCEMLKYMAGESASGVMLFPLKEGISNLTIYKMFTIHYLFSFLIILMVMFHIYLLHKSGSSSLNVGFAYQDNKGFFSLMFKKDILILLSGLTVLFYVIFFMPELFTSGDTNMEVEKKDSMEISVEWYLSVFFSMLSALNDKSNGMQSMMVFMLIIILYLFFKNLWGVVGLMGNLIVMGSLGLLMGVVITSTYTFSPSLFSMSLILILCGDLALNTQMLQDMVSVKTTIVK